MITVSYHLKLCCWVVRQDAGMLRASLTPVLIQLIPKTQLSKPGEEQKQKFEIKMSLAVPPIVHTSGFPMDRYQCFVLLHYIWRRDRKRSRILLSDKELKGCGNKKQRKLKIKVRIYHASGAQEAILFFPLAMIPWLWIRHVGEWQFPCLTSVNTASGNICSSRGSLRFVCKA